MPQCNTAWIGVGSRGRGWSSRTEDAAPQIIDAEMAHPLLEWVELGDVALAEATPLVVPPGGSTLVDSDAGPLLAIAPREGFEDAVLGFVIVDEVTSPSGKKEKHLGTNWPIRSSFPVFVLNVFDYLGGCRRQLQTEDLRPGRVANLELRATTSENGTSRNGTSATFPDGPAGASHKLDLSPSPAWKVRTPTGKTTQIEGGKGGRVTFADTAEVGVYEVRAGEKTVQRFAVNLFDPAESNIRPDPLPSLKIGYVEVAGSSGWQSTRRETWKWIVLIGLGVLSLEWYTYNRRVTV